MTPQQAPNTIREKAKILLQAADGWPTPNRYTDAVAAILAALKVLEDAANERDAWAAETTMPSPADDLRALLAALENADRSRDTATGIWADVASWFLASAPDVLALLDAAKEMVGQIDETAFAISFSDCEELAAACRALTEPRP